MSEAELTAEARVLLAAKLFEVGRVSAGLAAELAGLDRLTFLASLARYGVPAINLRGEEITREIEAARKLKE
jgi:predicted HTH domain antitoxin